jgi:flavin-dependent dehydrogenase
MAHYDVLIIGAEPAGLTAGLYCGRARLQTLILEKGISGGELINTAWIEDYPSFEAIGGPELAERLERQARTFGVEIKTESGGPGFDPRTGQSHHYAFHVSEAEFATTFGRVKAKGLPYGSGPYSHTDGQLYTRRGGLGFYFEDPYGHPLEVMTVPETGS